MAKSQTFNGPNNSASAAVDAVAPLWRSPDLRAIRGEPIPSAATQSINAISVIMNNFLAGKCTAATEATATEAATAAKPETLSAKKKRTGQKINHFPLHFEPFSIYYQLLAI